MSKIHGHSPAGPNKSAEVERSSAQTLKMGVCVVKCHEGDAHVNLVGECHELSCNNRKAIIPGTAGIHPSKYYINKAQKNPRINFCHHSQSQASSLAAPFITLQHAVISCPPLFPSYPPSFNIFLRRFHYVD